MKTRYWKFVDTGKTWRVYRLKDGVLSAWKFGSWQTSDYLERVFEDPEFVEISKAEADVLIQMVGKSS